MTYIVIIMTVSHEVKMKWLVMEISIFYMCVSKQIMISVRNKYT